MFGLGKYVAKAQHPIPNFLGHPVSSKFFVNLMRGKFEVDMSEKMYEYKLIKITESEGTQTELMTNKRVIN